MLEMIRFGKATRDDRRSARKAAGVSRARLTVQALYQWLLNEGTPTQLLLISSASRRRVWVVPMRSTSRNCSRA